MNTRITKTLPLTNFWVWGFICILLIGLQIAGLANLSIFVDWMRYGIDTLLEIIRFYGGLVYLAAGWFFWTLFTLDVFEKKFVQGCKPSIGDIGPLPFLFLFALAFWPFVVIYFSRRTEEEINAITKASSRRRVNTVDFLEILWRRRLMHDVKRRNYEKDYFINFHIISAMSG